MAQSLKSLTLFPREPAPPPRGYALFKPRSDQLWIAAHLPNLALDALARPGSSGPVVVVELRGGRFQVVAANERAAARGIEPGLDLSAARALHEGLEVLERSCRAERTALESLAAWACRITPAVSLVPPEGLLLEVKGSLRLFGGLAAIKEVLACELVRRRLKFHLCAAPTALASFWLAREGNEDVGSPRELAGRLGALSLRATRWPDKIQALLQDMGIRSIGDCLRLPRDGFARRAGAQYLLDLDKALGRQFDPRIEFEAPRVLSSMLELRGEATGLHMLWGAAQRLIDRLALSLRRRQAQVRSIDLIFHHAHRLPTVERMIFAEPAHERKRFQMLICDRLERLVLPAPVTALGLKTGRLEPMSSKDAALLPDRPPPELEGTSVNQLLERLRSRLGAEQVYAIGTAAEHRPEAAWIKLTDYPRRKGSSSSPLSPWADCRPLWILPSPLPLSDATGGPRYRGALQLESGPERIETGWWDAHDVVRDYYTASTACGERLWVFQERLQRGWYLHGIFG